MISLKVLSTAAAMALVGSMALPNASSAQGPGIKDPSLAMRDGYSTARSLGMGLPGARRLMDEFEQSMFIYEQSSIVKTPNVLTDLPFWTDFQYLFSARDWKPTYGNVPSKWNATARGPHPPL